MIVGLDVSTSCTGVAVVSDDGAPLLVGAVITGHLEDLTSKASAVAAVIESHVLPMGQVSGLFVEESLQAFRPGFSSANTICSLAKMNGVVAVLASTMLAKVTRYVSAQTARKMCDIKIKRGDNAKDEVVKWARLGLLRKWDMPAKKRSDGVVEQVKDACDALVIASAGALLIREESREVKSESSDVNVNSVVPSLVSGESSGQDRCVQIWKGSVSALSIRVLPV